MACPRIPTITSAAAAALDAELFSATHGFSIDTLMELAGLSVAHAIHAVWPPSPSSSRVLVVSGPGNNGGDGLVAARHLFHFGYRPFIVVPRAPKEGAAGGAIFERTCTQLRALDIPISSVMPTTLEVERDFDLVVDAVFGFSFRGEVREPFIGVLRQLSAVNTIPLISIDVPSGWPVDGPGPTAGAAPALRPHMLVSLTAPKPCSAFFEGPHHWLGGRFLPPSLARRYGLELPPFPGTQSCVRLK
jgi:hydroxyethylthiazole kinase-like uncharacterized protein yjeF